MGLVYWPLHIDINGDGAFVSLRMHLSELEVNAELRHIYLSEYENEVLDCLRQLLHEIGGCEECGTTKSEHPEVTVKLVEWAQRLADIAEGKIPLHAKKEEKNE